GRGAAARRAGTAVPEGLLVTGRYLDMNPIGLAALYTELVIAPLRSLRRLQDRVVRVEQLDRHAVHPGLALALQPVPVRVEPDAIADSRRPLPTTTCGCPFAAGHGPARLQAGC